MANITEARKALVSGILEGDGKASRVQRSAAFNYNAGPAKPLATLIDKVVRHAHKITDEDIAAVKASGLTEDEIFELVVCAAAGEATRQYESALAALVEATANQK